MQPRCSMPGILSRRTTPRSLLALMATTNEEHEGWLRKASPTHSFVRRNLLKLEGSSCFGKANLSRQMPSMRRLSRTIKVRSKRTRHRPTMPPLSHWHGLAVRRDSASA